MDSVGEPELAKTAPRSWESRSLAFLKDIGAGAVERNL